ncbi:hypothetical protein COMNV_00056 [Commensalibacter sp. Nvir]|nr:hypothetical protein COMNV_00056 [Commensalibacter sp. Nvir]
MKYYNLSLLLSIILFLFCTLLNHLHLKTEYVFLVIGLTTFIFLSVLSTILKIKMDTLKKKHEKQLSILRHDIRGLLSPALLMADRILLNQSIDEKTKKSATMIADSIESITHYLNQIKR